MAAPRSPATWAAKGWNLGLELQPGSHHSAWRPNISSSAVPRASAPVSVSPPRRSCCGGPTAASTAPDCCLRWPTERDRWAELGRSFDYLTKWNPRRQDKAAWVARAEAAGVFDEVRAGKRVGLLDLKIERAWKKAKARLPPGGAGDRAHDRQEGPAPAGARYRDRRLVDQPRCGDGRRDRALQAPRDAHEQFHSEIKTDLDLSACPRASSTPTMVVHLAAFAYNCLRSFGNWA